MYGGSLVNCSAAGTININNTTLAEAANNYDGICHAGLVGFASAATVTNCTNDIEESLYAERIIILYDKALACEGKTLSVLNEEKLLKRLGIGLPFLVELNKYFMDYGMIDKYHLTNEKLVNALWK